MKKQYLVSIADETLNIINNGKYTVSGKEFFLDSEKIKAVKVYSLKHNPDKTANSTKSGNIIIKPSDSFGILDLCDISGKTCILNFASAKNPGGGFQRGAKAQEEQLCFCSTLYASIGSEKAYEMYKYNRENYNTLYSDYMLYSPYVKIIRNSNYELLETPRCVSIITAPAVNRNIAERNHTQEEIFNCMLNRAEKILNIAIENDNKNIVLGAWGCGVFRNSVYDIAEIFRTLLIDENYISSFENVIFASFNEKNNQIFKNALEL